MWKSLWRWIRRKPLNPPRRVWERQWSRSENARWNLEGASGYYIQTFEQGLVKPGDACLDLGCGLGHSAAWLAEKGLQVLGVDYAQAAINQARALHPETHSLGFRQLDVTVPCPELGQFDAIFDRGCLHVLSDRAGYYRNLNTWLKPGGLFVLLHHFNNYSAEKLRREVVEGLSPECTVIEETPIDMIENSQSEAIPGLLLVVRKSVPSSERAGGTRTSAENKN
jgi:SAM-dependent methyltransferase